MEKIWQIFTLACLLSAIPCAADVITVDDDGHADYGNIQAAIDAANDGDINHDNGVNVIDFAMLAPARRICRIGWRRIDANGLIFTPQIVIDCWRGN